MRLTQEQYRELQQEFDRWILEEEMGVELE